MDRRSGKKVELLTEEKQRYVNFPMRVLIIYRFTRQRFQSTGLEPVMATNLLHA
jgi:hypothetical protein